MKKNTLLYLDGDLVEKAKRENINISRLAEDALKQALNICPPRTAHEYLQRVLEDAGRELALYGEAYFIPFQIESLRLENVGPFGEFEAKFARDAVNVIWGLSGSGKSIMVRSILLAFGKRHTHFAEAGKGKITLKLFSDQGSVSVRTNEESQSDITRGYKCLVADNIFQRASGGLIPELCREMRTLGIQIIVTASTAVDLSKFPPETQIISLKRL